MCRGVCVQVQRQVIDVVLTQRLDMDKLIASWETRESRKIDANGLTPLLVPPSYIALDSKVIEDPI